MSDLASQFEKTMMAHAFLECVDQLLTVAHASLVKDPHLAVTAIFQTWLQWFKTAGSGVEWLELATVERECRQLYEQYKGEEWAPVNPSLEFLMDNLMAGMTVSALAVASASDTAKHLVGALAVARGEGWSKGCRGEEAANCGDIQEEQIEEMFTDKRLATLLHWQKASTVVDTGLGAGMKLEKAKGKVTVLLVKQQEYKRMQGACNNCWANNDPEGCCLSLLTLQEEVTSGSSGGAKAKSKEWVESNEDSGDDGSDNDNDNKVPLAQKQAASPASVASAKQPRMVASEEGEGDVEMREMTPLATVAEVKQEASNMEVKGEEEFEAAPAAIEKDEEEERAEEVKVDDGDTPLRQVGDNELEWLGKDLGWPMPLMSVALLADFDKRAAGVEQQFQRELEAARKELLAHDCQAFLAWQEENNIREGDWKEAEDPVEVPDDNADLNA
ncbi:hypothetical protein E4T56_gene11368 [Termitomyces sp. T112]|nr:hypothetical protein E4T56_gene11368 [Termitomyces sp. T112]